MCRQGPHLVNSPLFTTHHSVCSALCSVCFVIILQWVICLFATTDSNHWYPSLLALATSCPAAGQSMPSPSRTSSSMSRRMQITSKEETEESRSGQEFVTMWWWWCFFVVVFFLNLAVGDSGEVQGMTPRLRIFFFFFLMWRSARVHLFHSVGQDQSTMASRAKTTIDEHSLTSCV